MNETNTLARLRLALIPGLGPLTQEFLVRRFGSAALVWERFADAQPPLPPAVVTSLTQGPDSRLLDRCLRWAEEPGHVLLAFEDVRYPPALRHTRGPPSVLWAMGELSRLQGDCVAMVGARNATPQGVRDAEDMARALSAAGLTIVSGLALGIDAAAHRGGLAHAGSSVGVMGTGMDILYPRRNRELAARIAAEGCLLTEFPLGTPPASGNFPRRNRIISGLSRAVLVVEANENSGSLLTADCALQQDRDVLAMPGSIHSPLAKGCHKLIKQGAALVETAADVFEALGMAPRVPATMQGSKWQQPEDGLLRAMGHAPMSPDQIASRSGLATATVIARLSRLQISGQIEEVASGRFQRVDRPS
jgi:DNA processing protein